MALPSLIFGQFYLVLYFSSRESSLEEGELICVETPVKITGVSVIVEACNIPVLICEMSNGY